MPELQLSLMPPQVVVSAEQYQVVDLGCAAVGEVVQVVGVAEGRRSGAAAFGAAVVAAGQGAALGGGDRVTEGF